MEPEVDPLLNKERHKNKRNMAYIALTAMITMTVWLIVWVDPAVIDRYDNVVGTVYTALVAIIMTYMGSVTTDSAIFYWKNRNNKDQ